MKKTTILALTTILMLVTGCAAPVTSTVRVPVNIEVSKGYTTMQGAYSVDVVSKIEAIGKEEYLTLYIHGIHKTTTISFSKYNVDNYVAAINKYTQWYLQVANNKTDAIYSKQIAVTENGIWALPVEFKLFAFGEVSFLGINNYNKWVSEGTFPPVYLTPKMAILLKHVLIEFKRNGYAHLKNAGSDLK